MNVQHFPQDFVPVDSNGSQQASQSNFKASPFVWTDPDAIPPRAWLYGYHLIRKFVSVTIAPGGLGKSSLLLTEAIAMATGKPLLGRDVAKPLRVWLWNLEDPADELARRIQAICLHHGITADDIGDRLFIDTGREQELCTAITGKNGAVIQQPVIDNLTDELRQNAIDVLIVDPFISSHQVDENNNPAMDMVTKAWGKIADRTNTAIALVHHTRKQSGDTEVSADSARGAKALVDAARDVRCLTRMTEEQGEAAGVDNHRLHFRVYSDKANLAPPADKSEWYRLENVALSNGDYVGVVAQWSWPNPFDDVTVADLKAVQLAVDGKQYRKDVRSKDLWVGNVIADVIGADLSEADGEAKVKSILKTWLDNDALKAVQVTTEKRNKAWVIQVGEWVS